MLQYAQTDNGRCAMSVNPDCSYCGCELDCDNCECEMDCDDCTCEGDCSNCGSEENDVGIEKLAPQATESVEEITKEEMEIHKIYCLRNECKVIIGISEEGIDLGSGLSRIYQEDACWLFCSMMGRGCCEAQICATELGYTYGKKLVRYID